MVWKPQRIRDPASPSLGALSSHGTSPFSQMTHLTGRRGGHTTALLGNGMDVLRNTFVHVALAEFHGCPSCKGGWEVCVV